MVAQATSNDRAYSGLRPINSSRDIVSRVVARYRAGTLRDQPE